MIDIIFTDQFALILGITCRMFLGIQTGLKASTYYSWDGKFANCPIGMVVTGLCASGKSQGLEDPIKTFNVY